MPTFTAIALDRLLEPGASKSVDKSGPTMKPPLPKPKVIPNSNLERRNGASVTERKVNHPQISSPALYATPEATPLPDSPSSFPPSPYIINHKRRGPRLLKSFSENNVSSQRKTTEESEINGKAELTETKSLDLSKDGFIFNIHEPDEEEHENGVNNGPIKVEQANGFHSGSFQDEHMNGVHDTEFGSSNKAVGSSRMNNGMASGIALSKVVPLILNKDDESENFFDPKESMSTTTNTDGDDPGAESAARLATSGVEFFDAWDELSSESGTQSSYHDSEAEVREIRLSLLVEIEKRKQAEEALNKMLCMWKRIGQELAVAGLSLPADPIDVTGDELVNQAEALRQQAYIARFVSLSVGRGIARAEMETEMEAQIDSKNFEISRLWDKLHYYEAVNQEMTQRNQEAIEMARRERQRKKRRQRWVWGSIATAITLGTAALAWSYLPTSKGSSSGNIPQASDSADDAAK
ncbi:hypothetical protein like AT3G50910 [Hibiscus trionum]|uniref:Uncharacterized protein n=1 Tax=Hibiscus trionum TaxID=183268 RepID=A0A9W7MKB7_HIBTR|nr:hypothetical protein like AT3G50910 [Hibiscus trionum]